MGRHPWGRVWEAGSQRRQLHRAGHCRCPRCGLGPRQCRVVHRQGLAAYWPGVPQPLAPVVNEARVTGIVLDGQHECVPNTAQVGDDAWILACGTVCWPMLLTATPTHIHSLTARARKCAMPTPAPLGGAAACCCCCPSLASAAASSGPANCSVRQAGKLSGQFGPQGALQPSANPIELRYGIGTQGQYGRPRRANTCYTLWYDGATVLKPQQKLSTCERMRRSRVWM